MPPDHNPALCSVQLATDIQMMDAWILTGEPDNRSTHDVYNTVD